MMHKFIFIGMIDIQNLNQNFGLTLTIIYNLLFKFTI